MGRSSHFSIDGTPASPTMVVVDSSGNSSSSSGHHRWCTFDTMVSTARAVNKLFTRHTYRVCHVYVDKQVAFEQATAESPVERAALKMMGHELLRPEVEVYRRFLFDEDSVIETVGSRDQQDVLQDGR